MSDTNRAGFEIRGRFYPWAQQFRTLDPLLIVEVTGMKYLDFLDQWQTSIATLEDEEGAGIDPIIMNGLIAVAYWQAHPEKSRAAVVKFFEHLDQDALEVVGGEDEEEGHPDPLSEGGNGSTQSVSSPPKPTTLNGTQESPSEQLTQVSTGPLPSITSVPV